MLEGGAQGGDKDSPVGESGLLVVKSEPVLDSACEERRSCELVLVASL